MKTQEVHAAPQTIGAMTKTGSGVPAAVSFASVLSGIREEARARAAGILRDAAPCAREEATTKLRGDLSTETVRRLLPDGTLRITEYQDGKVKSVLYRSPELIAVPDFSDPSWHSTPDGLPAAQKKMKLVAHSCVLEEE